MDDGTWRQGFIVNSCIFYHCNVWRIQRKLSKKPCRQVLSMSFANDNEQTTTKPVMEKQHALCMGSNELREEKCT